MRPEYELNADISDIPIFAPSDSAGQFDHLGGFRPIPSQWTIDWGFFVKIGRSKPQLSRRLDTRLARPLLRLPGGLDAAHNSLATLNLRRGKALQLPSGQAVAEAMGLTPLATDDLGLARFELSDEQRAPLEQATLPQGTPRLDARAHTGARGGAFHASRPAQVCDQVNPHSKVQAYVSRRDSAANLRVTKARARNRRSSRHPTPRGAPRGRRARELDTLDALSPP